MKKIKFNISPLHAETIAVHLLIVLKNFVTGKKEGSIPDETMELLSHLDVAYQKLSALSDSTDDETPQPVALSIPEAEAFIKAFTEERFQAAALKDEFYQRHSYPAYFAQIYSKYAEQVSEGYVEALAA
ncbi:MAG: hypothetical protein H6573_34990 [Lewinellaceae bacterium]|nr:hypothetical protein [Phaeodactylibacter sp.]MCB9352654.1 hypothetical protein [Lewinellaceae bacterium]